MSSKKKKKKVSKAAKLAKKWKKRVSANNKSNRYEIWLTYNSNKNRLQIPVLPEKIEISYPDKNDTVYVYGVGEVTIKKHPGAFVMKWSGFFPAVKCQGCISNPKKPKECLDFLKEVMKIAKPAKIVYTGGACRLSSQCTIEFEASEEGGDLGTIHYSITVTEYKKTAIRKLKIKTAKNKKKNGSKKKAKVTKTSNRTSSKSKAGKYTVKKGDCLWNIAKKFYGKGAKYTVLYNANKKVIGGNPNLIYPGQVLTIPKE